MSNNETIDYTIRIPDFKSSIKRSERFADGLSSYDYRNINSFIRRIYNFIQQKKEENPDMTRSDLFKLLYDYNDRLSDAAFTNSSVLNHVSAYNSCIYLNQHPKKFKEISDYIDKEHITSKTDYFVRGESFDENLVKFVLFMKRHVPEALEIYNSRLPDFFLQIINADNLSIPEKEELSKRYASRFPVHQRTAIMNTVKLNLYGIPQYLKTYPAHIESELRECLIESTIEIVDLLDEMQCFDDWIESENKQFTQLGIPEIKITPELLRTQLSVPVLNSLGLKDLIGINTMYVNRLFHVIESHSRANFAIEEFNLEPLLTDSDSAPVVDENSLKAMMIKMNFFYLPSEIYYTQNEEIIADLDKEGKLDVDPDANSYTYSTKPLEEELRKTHSKEYTSYFSGLLSASKNDVVEDFSRFTPLANTIHLLKDTKTKNSLAFISLLLLENDPKSNYGIVLDEVSEDGTCGDTKHFVDFMADINSISPVNIHLRADSLRDFLSEYLDTTIMPIYAGADDWKLPNGYTMKSHIMMPWSKNMTKSIKKLSKSPNITKQDAVDHLRSLGDEKAVPPGLKKSPKNKQIYKTYFNFDSKSILEMINGVYIRSSSKRR